MGNKFLELLSQRMGTNQQKSVIAATALIVLGILVLLAGKTSLVLLIPVAALVWYRAAPKLRSGRN